MFQIPATQRINFFWAINTLHNYEDVPQTETPYRSRDSAWARYNKIICSLYSIERRLLHSLSSDQTHKQSSSITYKLKKHSLWLKLAIRFPGQNYRGVIRIKSNMNRCTYTRIIYVQHKKNEPQNRTSISVESKFDVTDPMHPSLTHTCVIKNNYWTSNK